MLKLRFAWIHGAARGSATIDRVTSAAARHVTAGRGRFGNAGVLRRSFGLTRTLATAAGRRDGEQHSAQAAMFGRQRVVGG
jgi:hypothetical protein